jgi:hypothetical protein
VVSDNSGERASVASTTGAGAAWAGTVSGVMTSEREVAATKDASTFPREMRSTTSLFLGTAYGT